MSRQSAKVPSESPMFPRDAIENFHIFRRGLGLAPATLELDRYILEPFEKKFPEWWKSPRQSFVSYLDSSRTAWTRQTRLRIFRVLLRYMHEEENLPPDVNPLRGVRASIPAKRAEATDAETIRAFLSSLGNHWTHRRLRVCVLLLAETGLRRSELCALQWSDVDMSTRTLRVRAETAKTRRERVVPFGLQVARELEGLRRDAQKRFPGEGGAVFLDVNGGAMTPNALSKQVKAVVKAKGIKGFHLHGLRHHAATDLIRATGSLALAARLLGHTKISTTAQFYEHLSNEDLRSGMEKAATLRGISARKGAKS